MIELVTLPRTGERIPMCLATQRRGEAARYYPEKECRAPVQHPCWATRRVAKMLNINYQEDSRG